MNGYLGQYKSLKLGFLFTAALIVLIFSTNICFAGIVVKLEHVDVSSYSTDHTIQAYVTVVDDQGNAFTDFTASNFSVMEDNSSQTLTNVTFLPQPHNPFSIVLAMDYSGTVKPVLSDIESAALGFIDQLKNGDVCELIKFDDVVRVVEGFTNDKDQLKNAVKEPWVDTMGSTKVYDAVYQAIQDTASNIASVGNTGVVILLSDGYDSADPGHNASSHTLDDVISLAKSSNIRIFTVGFGASIRPDVLQRMAGETNGKYFLASSSADISSIYSAIGTELHGGYVISYVSGAKGCPDQTEHTLQIDVNTGTGSTGNDTKSFLLCPSSSSSPNPPATPPSSGGSPDPSSDSGGGGGGGCFVSSLGHGFRQAR